MDNPPLRCGILHTQCSEMMRPFPNRRLGLLISALLCVCAASTMAQEAPSTNTLVAEQGATPTETAFPCFGAPNRAASKQHWNEAIARLPESARFWLTEDVVFIISPEERCAFLHLETDQERDQFIEQFWARRAPDPTSFDNSFKREHYERIVAANQKFSTQVPGWKTDRGRSYVMFGPPDSIESHRSGEKTGRPADEGVETYTYSWEAWRYRHIDGVGENIEVEFVDPTGSGDYVLSTSPDIKDRLILDSPYALSRSLHTEQPARSEEKTQFIVVIDPAPQVHFKDLEAVVVSRLARDQVGFTHRIEFAKATHATTLATISMSLASEHPGSPNSVANAPAEFEIFVRVAESSGRITDTFERRLSLPPQDNFGSLTDLEFPLALSPGTYGLAIVVKDLGRQELGTLRTSFDVPSYDDIRDTK
jgi:GWxTD domain-containing protein